MGVVRRSGGSEVGELGRPGEVTDATASKKGSLLLSGVLEKSFEMGKGSAARGSSVVSVGGNSDVNSWGELRETIGGVGRVSTMVRQIKVDEGSGDS